VAPRRLAGSRSRSRLTALRARQRELVRSRRRGYRLVAGSASTDPSGRVDCQLGCWVAV